MFSLLPIDAKKGWFLLFLVVGMFGFADVEHEAGEAVQTTAACLGIACTLWVIWQLMGYDER